MAGDEAYFRGLLEEVRADGAWERWWRRNLLYGRFLALIDADEERRPRLTAELSVNAESLERLRLAEARVRERLASLDGPLAAPHH